ncbi:hypothetical protein Tco_0804495 [Tanacetum coccineum]|uniref:Uncharacterized protein n=1 Tax=Tanacetum coccineum TaxID=301880 RepID=A0ABQ5A8N2_9ASTR
MFGDDNWNEGFGTTSDRQQYRRRFLYNRSGFPQTDFRHGSVNEGWYVPAGNVVFNTSGYVEGDVVLDFKDSAMRESSRSDLVGENGYAQWAILFNHLIMLYGIVRHLLWRVILRMVTTASGSSSLQNVNGIGLSAARNVRPPTVNQTGCSLFMDSNCVNNSGQNCPDNVSRQNSPANIGHKFTGIGNSIGSRRSHTTDRKTLPHVPSASIVGSMNAQPKGISSYYIDIGDCDCSCEHCDAKFWYGERLKGCSTDREIGSLCPTKGDPPRFLQLYIYDTENEVANRMRHFRGTSSSNLDPVIVQRLIGFLDEHNKLVRLFWTARDKCACQFVPDFKIRLYSVVGAREYDLPTSQTLSGIVF